MQTYYAVCGDNGVMVASSQGKVLSCIGLYFRGHRWYEDFDRFKEAQEAALNHLDIIAHDRECPEWLVLDRMVTVSKLPLKIANNDPAALVEPIIWFRPPS